MADAFSHPFNRMVDEEPFAADAFAPSRAQTQVQAASQSSSALTPSDIIIQAARRHETARSRMPPATLRDAIPDWNAQWQWQYEARWTVRRSVWLNNHPHDPNWGAWQPQFRPEVVPATTLENPQAAVEEEVEDPRGPLRFF